MLPQDKRLRIKLWSKAPNAFISSTQKDLSLKSFIQANIQDENIKDIPIIQRGYFKLNCKLARNNTIEESPKGTQLLKSKLLSMGKLDSLNTQSKQQKPVEARIRKSYSIVGRSAKSTNQSVVLVNQSCAQLHKMKLKEPDKLFELPNEESYNEIKEFTQSVKQVLKDLGYSKLLVSSKSSIKLRVMTADTETSDKQSPKLCHMSAKDSIERKSVQVEDQYSSSISTRGNSVGATERKELEETNNDYQTRTIDELSQESEEDALRVNDLEEVLPRSLGIGIDLLELKIAVSDIMFIQI